MAALTVIGVGNRMRGDDAVGPLLIDEMSKSPMAQVELIDAGLDALGVLEYFQGRDRVIIVDACRMGREPGDVAEFDVKEASMILRKDQISLHGLGLAEALNMAEALDLLPKRVKIIGIEPLSVEIGGEISPAVKKALTTAMDYIQRELLETEEAL